MILAALLSLTLAASAPPPRAAAAVEEAKALYRNAAFAEAVLELRAAIDALLTLDDSSVQKSRLSDAYLYLSLSHLGLNQREAAQQAFQELVRLDPGRQLDPEVYAPKVLELFAEARVEVERETTANSAASALPPAAASPPRGPTRKWWWAGAGAAAVAGGVALVTHDRAPAPAVLALLTLNGEVGGTFSCSGGLFFRLSASNPTGQAVRLDRFNLTFTSSSASCASHGAPVFGDAVEVRELPPDSADVQLRRMDLNADLCQPPNGNRDGCTWQANVVLQTDVGNFGRDLQFTTTR
jgi:hypothetical protein